MRNKFYLDWILLEFLTFLLILESKLDNNFPNTQLKIDHYKTFKLDQNRYRGGLILQINEQVRCKMLTNHENSIASEIIILKAQSCKLRKH